MHLKKLLLSLLIISSCGGGGGGGGGSGPPDPSISLNSNSLDVNLGDSVTISWSSSNTTSCSASWTNSTGTSGTESITINSPGNNNISISCSGEGGSSTQSVTIFAFDVGLSLKQFSVDEDSSSENSIIASPNSEVTLSYEITSNPSNGNLSYNSLTNSITYTPSADFFGSDQFVYSVTIDERSLVVTETVQITVNPINDPPVLQIFTDLSGFTSTNLVIDDDLDFSANVTDVDNELSELNFYAELSNSTSSATQNVPSSFSVGQGLLTVNTSQIQTAGLQQMRICVSDSSGPVCSASFESYFVANKQIKSIDHDCDSNGQNCTSTDHYFYYIVGGPNELSATNYLIIGDQLNSQSDQIQFRREVMESVETLRNSDAGSLIDGYFNIAVVEEVGLNGVSAFDIRIGCYSLANVYCVDEVDMNKLATLWSDFTIAAFITTLNGRGVASGQNPINIQQLEARTEEVVMHELGHTHGFMGDEYNSGGEQGTDIQFRANYYINTTTQTDPERVKWKHFIEDTSNVPGLDYDICYNFQNGDIYSRDLVGDGTYADCECFYNQYPTSQDYPGTNEDPNCVDKVGIIPGTYYGEDDTYRPLYWTVMETGAEQDQGCGQNFCYGEVNIEGFAVGSIQNQGFTLSDISVNGTSITSALRGSSLSSVLEISLNANYDTSKLKLSWYINGEEQTSLENQTTVSFTRPSNGAVKYYSYKIEDLTGNLVAPNDPLQPLDFYEGWFESYYYYDPNHSNPAIPSIMPYISSWGWWDGSSYQTDNNVSFLDRGNYKFGVLCCSMSASLYVNWSLYDTETSNPPTKDKESRRLELLSLSPSTEKTEKIVKIKFDKNNLDVESITTDKPKKVFIRKPIVKRSDKYAVSFYDNEMNLIYEMGIGDPFSPRIQHIGYEDQNVFHVDKDFDVNLDIVIPNEIIPSYISISERQIGTDFKQISIIDLNS